MDIVGFMGLGDDEKSNREKLTALYNGINKQDTSNLILLEPSSQIVADTLLSGPLFGNNGGAEGENGGGDMMDEYQLAIKLSLQEAQEEEKKRIESTLGSTSNTSTTSTQNNKMEDEDELDEETRKAIALSMQMEQEENNNMDDEEESARQLSLDLKDEVNNEKKEISEALKDVSVDDLFGNLPGVTTDSEQIQNALKNIKGEEKKDQNNNNNQDKKDK